MKQDLSALMDGECDAHDAERVIGLVSRDDSIRDDWATYHLIGEAMRGEQVTLDRGFSARLQEALSSEPTVLAPAASQQRRSPAVWAVAAGVMGVAVAVGAAMSIRQDGATLQQQPVLAQAPAQQPLPVRQIAREDERHLILVHQEHSPVASRERLAPYVRSVALTSGR